MRKSLLVLLLFALFCACSDREKYARLLVEADSLNQNYIPFTSDSLMLDIVDYYTHHGSANQRMKAHYLLGCAYRDLGEAPRALQCFHDAIECADTTAHDCDYKLLGRVHGQMATLLGHQFLPHDMLLELHETHRMAVKGNDTVNALVAIERQAVAYKLLNMPDSCVMFLEKACSLFKKYGMEQDEAITSQSLALSYIGSKNYVQAKKCIDLFEQKSGMVDLMGTVAKGYESFYYDKGLYYLGIHQLDSAEIFFRKLIKVGNDLNHQEAANRGLYLLYKEKNIADSAAKYADISYQINDRRDMLASSEEVSHVRALYNYVRNENLASKEHLSRMKTQIWLTCFIALFMIVLVLSFSYIRHLRRKRKREQMSFQAKIEQLAHAKDELQQLETMQTKELIERKTLEIQLLGMEIRAYRQMHSGAFMKIESAIADTAIYKRFAELGNAKGEATTGDWKKLSEMTDEKIPQFQTILNSTSSHLRIDEYRLCLLVRLFFSPAEIANILTMKPSAITMMRCRLHRKIFGTEGTAKEFDRKIKQIGRST